VRAKGDGEVMMRTVGWALIYAVLFLGFGGCAGDGPTVSGGGGGGATLAAIQQDIFTPSCAISGCHNALTQAGTLNLQDEATSFSEMVGVVSTCADRILVTAGDPDASYLLDKLGDGPQAPCGTVMPIGLPSVSASDLQRIRDWILAGAPQGALGAATGTTSTTSTTSTTVPENRP